ncbi:rRNA (cytidine-2'-O-)-methyltransferase, partial [Treponema pallidum]
EELCVGTALRVMESFCARTRVRGECVLLVSAEKF